MQALTVRTAALALAAIVGLALPTPAPLLAQTEAGTDSASLVTAAREKQREFERFRQSRIPVQRSIREGSCDAQIGRICIWFGGDDEASFPEEPPETENARKALLNVLLRAEQVVGDPWVTGQLVHYMVEQKDYDLAERVARICGLEEEWWCTALLGYVMHVRGDFVESEAAFRAALDAMPDEEYEQWVTPRYIFPADEEEGFNNIDAGARTQLWETYWRLSDPLFLVDGNDRLTDHFARWVEARNQADAENPQGLLWDKDLEETLVRYGRMVGWSRTHSPTSPLRGGRMQLNDTRQVVGHHPRSRGYLFPQRFLESPSEIPPESWITAPREARTWYAPPYAPDFRALETQVGRFRRGEEMLVVGAYRPTPDTLDEAGAPRGSVEAGLFLIPEEGGLATVVKADDAEGTITLLAPPGNYVSSMEVLDAGAKRAWRARQGVRQVPMVRGLVAVSDLLILEEGAPFPTTLDDALPHVRKGVRVGRTERFTVVWEVYGLGVEDPAQVTIGFTRGRPGFLTRVGEFLGVLEPDRPVEVAFEDAGADGVQSAFRSIVLELPDLEPGDYTLHLRLDLPGRAPAITSRPIVVEGDP